METFKYLYLLVFVAVVLGGLWEDLKKGRTWLLVVPLCFADVVVFALALGPPLIDFTPKPVGFALIGFAIALNAVALRWDIRELREEPQDEDSPKSLVGCATFVALVVVLPAFAMAAVNLAAKP